jgi:excisionase family DNA binding protein
VTLATERLLTPQQATEYLGIPLRRFKRHVLAGDIPYVEFGERTRRYRPEDLDQFIADRLVTIKPARKKARR